MSNRLFILLPAYNEAQSLPPLLGKLEAFTGQHPEIQARVVVVDDGSTDGTAEVLAGYEGPLALEVITHKLNRGLGETARDGFERIAELAAPDDIIIRMDCDDTHEPEYMERMVEKVREGNDVVIASRYQPGARTEGVNGYRRFVSACAQMVMKLVFPIPGVREYSCGYRAYRAELIQAAIRIYGNHFIDLKGLGFTCTVEKLIRMRMLGARFAEVPFTLHYEQKQSDSKMVTSATTLGYLVLIIKYMYPWGPVGREQARQAAEFRRARGR